MIGGSFWFGAAAPATAATQATISATTLQGQCVEAFPVGGDYGVVVCSPW